MKNIIVSLLVVVSYSSLFGQTYYMDLVDGTTVNTCGGVFVDSDLCTSASYCDNENYTATFCSPSAGDAIRFDFNYLHIEDGYDFLYVYDGSSTGAPLIGAYTGNNPSDFPWAFVGQSGCITFEFISDNIGTDNGWEAIISCWSPPVACNGNAPAGDDCINATEICNLDGYCGNTSGWFEPDAIQIEEIAAGGDGTFCGTIENNSWLSFIASGTSASFTLTSSGCTSPSTGIQAVILETSDCSNFSLVSDGCFEQDGTGGNGEGTGILSANSLTPGNTYYVMIDGFAGNVCDYTVTANTGVLTVAIESSAGENLCPGECTTLTAIESGATSYSWFSVPAGASGSGSSINVCPTVTTTYSVLITGVCGGTQTAEITLYVGTPIVDFVAQSDLSNLGTSGMTAFVPNTVNCTDPPFYLVAEDSVDANNYITSALLFKFVSDGYSQADPTSVNLYSGGLPGTGTLIYSENPVANNTTLTVYPNGGYMSPTGNYYVEICDGYGDGGIDYEISDGNTAVVYASGSISSGNPCEVFGPFNPAGTANWNSTAPAGAIVTWDDGIMYFDPSVAGPGIYDFTYDWSDGVGCAGTATHTIEVVSPFDASWTAPNAVCEDVPINLNTLVTGDAGGTWSGTGVSGSTFNPSGLSGSIDITYSVGSPSTCAVSQMHSIFVNGLPTANAGAGSTINCAISSISLNGSGGGSYLWTTSNGSITGGATTATPSVNAGGVYTVTVTDGNGCSASDNVTLTEDFATPTATASVNQTLDCNINTATLTALGGGSYQWSTSNGTISGSTISSMATASAIGTYTVTVTGANGCTDTDVVTVNGDYSLPSASAGLDQVIDCNNTTANVSASGGGTYLWSTTNGNITGNINNSSTVVGSAGTYSVTVTGTNGCTASDNVVVIENLITPVADAGTAANITCTVTNVSLDGSLSSGSGISYTWVPSNGGNIISGQNAVSPSVNAAGTYTLTVTGINGCIDTDQVIVQADASVPTANAGSAVDLTCSTTSISLDGSGSTGSGLSYNWVATSGGNIVSGQTSVSPTINAAGTYTLTITASNGCTSTDIVTVNQNTTVPVVSIVNPQTIDCNDLSIVLDGSASSQGPNYMINWTTTGNIVSGQNSVSPTVDGSGTYTLEITDTDNGCINSSTINVNEDIVLPIANAGSDQVLTCAATSVFLNGAASNGSGITYQWSGPNILSGATTNTAEVNQPGQYTLTVEGSNGCIDVASVNVIPDANMPFVDAGSDQTIDCNTPTVVLDGSDSDSGMDYVWSTSDGNIVSGQNTPIATSNQNGTYTFTVTNPSNGCSAATNFTVITDTVSPSITILDSDTLNCNNTSILLEANSAMGIVYTWSTNDGNIVTGANSSTPTVDEAGVYNVVVTSANGCSANAEITVIIDTASPVANAGLDMSILCSQSEVVLDGSGSSMQNVTYSWSTIDGNIISGNQTLTPVVDAAGTYTIVVTGENGCVATSDVTVTVMDGPIAEFTPTPNQGQVPLEVYFDNTSTGSNLVYNWDFGDGNTTTDFDPINTYFGIQTYVVTLIVSDENGCTDSYVDSVIVEGESGVTVPNVFSPNGDGTNDLYTIDNSNLSSIEGVIMNRWGQVVYEWNTLESGWDGRTKSGVFASEGTYYYIINAVGMDGTLYDLAGPLQLIR